MQFLPDGKILDYSDNTIQIWEKQTLKDKFTDTSGALFYPSWVASPDGMVHVKENKKDGMLYLWNMKTRKTDC